MKALRKIMAKLKNVAEFLWSSVIVLVASVVLNLDSMDVEDTFPMDYDKNK